MQATQNVDKQATSKFEASQLLWALGSVCVLHQRNFSADMLVREFPPQAHNTGEGTGEGTGAATPNQPSCTPPIGWAFGSSALPLPPKTARACPCRC